MSAPLVPGRTPVLAAALALTLGACGGRTSLGPGNGPSAAGSPKGLLPAADGSCTAGRSLCGQEAAARCYDLQSNAENCGTCQNRCAVGIQCSTGACQQLRCTGSVSMAESQNVDYACGRRWQTDAARTHIVDVNGDGYPDLLSCADPTVEVHFGKGDGSFDTNPTILMTDSPPIVGVGDLDEDGALDLVAAGDTMGLLLKVWLGNGHGTHVVADDAESETSYAPVPVSLGDLDNDGHLDVVLATWEISVRLGNGDGTFSKPRTYSFGNDNEGIAWIKAHAHRQIDGGLGTSRPKGPVRQ